MENGASGYRRMISDFVVNGNQFECDILQLYLRSRGRIPVAWS